MKPYLYNIIFLFVLLSCDKNHKTPQLKLEELNGTWSLIRFIDKTSLKEDTLPGEYTAKISFRSNYTVDVHGPCNSGSGVFSMNGNQILITRLAMTERACDALNDENRFTSNISGTYSIKQDTLIIISDFDTNLLFRKTNDSQ